MKSERSQHPRIRSFIYIIAGFFWIRPIIVEGFVSIIISPFLRVYTISAFLKVIHAPKTPKRGGISGSTPKITFLHTVFPRIVVATTILFWKLRCDKYSRETTIQGRKLLFSRFLEVSWIVVAIPAMILFMTFVTEHIWK